MKTLCSVCLLLCLLELRLSVPSTPQMITETVNKPRVWRGLRERKTGMGSLSINRQLLQFLSSFSAPVCQMGPFKPSLWGSLVKIPVPVYRFFPKLQIVLLWSRFSDTGLCAQNKQDSGRERGTGARQK